MLQWEDLLAFSNKDNPASDRRVEKTDEDGENN